MPRAPFSGLTAMRNAHSKPVTRCASAMPASSSSLPGPTADSPVDHVLARINRRAQIRRPLATTERRTSTARAGYPRHPRHRLGHRRTRLYLRHAVRAHHVAPSAPGPLRPHLRPGQRHCTALRRATPSSKRHRYSVYPSTPSAPTSSTYAVSAKYNRRANCCTS